MKKNSPEVRERYYVNEKKRSAVCLLEGTGYEAFYRIKRYMPELVFLDPDACRISTKFIGQAKCQEDNEFVAEVGKKIAKARAINEKERAINRVIKKVNKELNLSAWKLETYGLLAVQKPDLSRIIQATNHDASEVTERIEQEVFDANEASAVMTENGNVAPETENTKISYDVPAPVPEEEPSAEHSKEPVLETKENKEETPQKLSDDEVAEAIAANLVKNRMNNDSDVVSIAAKLILSACAYYLLETAGIGFVTEPLVLDLVKEELEQTYCGTSFEMRTWENRDKLKKTLTYYQEFKKLPEALRKQALETLISPTEEADLESKEDVKQELPADAPVQEEVAEDNISANLEKPGKTMCEMPTTENPVPKDTVVEKDAEANTDIMKNQVGKEHDFFAMDDEEEDISTKSQDASSAASFFGADDEEEDLVDQKDEKNDEKENDPYYAMVVYSCCDSLRGKCQKVQDAAKTLIEACTMYQKETDGIEMPSITKMTAFLQNTKEEIDRKFSIQKQESMRLYTRFLKYDDTTQQEAIETVLQDLKTMF